MSIQPKTEQNVIGNVPCSRPAMSLESFIKDLQDLNKENTLITKKELETMKAMMKKLEKENAKLKTDSAAKDADLAAKDAVIAEKEEERLFYDRNFHQNVKELTKIKAENKSLKAEIASLKASSPDEQNNSECSSSSIQSAIPVNPSKSADEHETTIPAPILAICENNEKTSTSKPKVTRKIIAKEVRK